MLPSPVSHAPAGNRIFYNLGSLFPFLDQYNVLHRQPRQPLCDPCGATYYNNAKSLVYCVASVPSVESLQALYV
jgi:hypothetical protein